MNRCVAFQSTRQIKRYLNTTSTSSSSSTETIKTASKKKWIHNNNKKRNNKSNMNIPIAIGCFTFVVATGALPLLIVGNIQPLQSRDKALTAAQTRRGAFTNSGSRDAGIDPDWIKSNGQLVYQYDNTPKTHDELTEEEKADLTTARGKNDLTNPFHGRAM